MLNHEYGTEKFDTLIRLDSVVCTLRVNVNANVLFPDPGFVHKSLSTKIEQIGCTTRLFDMSARGTGKRFTEVMAAVGHDFYKPMNKNGRSDAELVQEAKRFPELTNKFMGVYAKDRIPKLAGNQCCIVNLQNSVDGKGRPLPGTHWISCGKRGSEAWAFDSYGVPPPLEILKALEPYHSLATNKRELQALDSIYCGDFALGACVALCKSPGHNTQEALNRYCAQFNQFDLRKHDQLLENFLNQSRRHVSGSGIVYEAFPGGNY